MQVWPKPGFKIRDPFFNDYLPPEGRDVDASDPYWVRRLSDEDVTDTQPKAAPVASQGSKQPSKPSSAEGA
jgi:hypothetical protein